MQGQKFISRMNFESNKHHRQILREQIRPSLIQKLQISDNPSANYMNAYKTIYKDQLEKTMEQHNQQKAKKEYQQFQQKATYSLQPRDKVASMPNQQSFGDNSSMLFTSSPMGYEQLENSRYPRGQENKTFRDYFEERTNKFQNHIKKNYDGGKDFFKVQDAYREKRLKETVNYADFLKKQLEEKQLNKLNLKEKENMEQAALKQMQMYQQELDMQKYMNEKDQRMHQKEEKIQEVENQRFRRHRRSKQFQYNNYAMHNPITNPIEYHIDNPYLLKKIQDKI